MTIARRPYRDGVELSILGFGGMVAVGMAQEAVNRITAESIERGVNYFDVAPFYGDGEAEKKLGTALGPCRSGVFLACKSLERSGAGLGRSSIAHSNAFERATLICINTTPS